MKKSYEKFIENNFNTLSLEHKKYPKIGKTFYYNNDDYFGFYWFYETEYFVVDIHDFFIKRDLESYNEDMGNSVVISSFYIFSGTGTFHIPKQPLQDNSLCVVNLKTRNYNYTLKEHTPYVSVGIKFKQIFLNSYLKTTDDSYHFNIFIETKEILTKKIKTIAKEIFTLNMEGEAAKLYLTAKVYEWFSLTLDSYLNKNKYSAIQIDDKKALVNVKNHIDKNFYLHLKQDQLAKIAFMSISKFKKLFYEQYGMSTTEYIQRQRIKEAEKLILSTDYEIKKIAKQVGYQSHGKFSTYFKKYKGCCPIELKKLTKNIKE